MVRFVVMGAGKASRMGQDKLALPWGNTTILGHVLQMIDSSLMLRVTQERPFKDEVIIVARKPLTAFDLDKFRLERPEASRFQNSEDSKSNLAEGFFDTSQEYKCSQEYKFRWIQVPGPQPLADTIRRGLSDLPDTAQGICFIPGDQVGLESHLLAELTSFFLEKTPDFLVPQVGGVTGSPVFFHARYLPELLALQGEQGGKRILETYRERWTTYPVREEFLLDIDTLEEYEKYRPPYRYAAPTDNEKNGVV